MDKPFSFLLLPFTLGVTFTYYFNFSPYLPVFLMILVLFYLLYNIIKGSLNQRVLFLMFFCLAIFSSLLADRSELRGYIGEDQRIVGLVDQLLFKDEEKARYVLKVDKLGDQLIKKERMVLTVLGEDSQGLSLGDRIAFRSQVKLPDENTNPKLYNYRLALKADRIHTRASVKDFQVEILEGERSLGYRIKASFINHVENLFSSYLSPEGADLMTSIILGKSSYLNEDFLKTYRDLGLAHILAVSGLHIGIISGFVFFVLVKLGVRRRTNLILTLVFIWTYGFIIDFPPSILRANLMFSLIYYSQLIHEPYDSINSLSLAALVLLIPNPYNLFNIGFQLSFMASWSILVLMPRLEAAFYPYNNKLTDSLAAVLAVGIGLFPIQAYYFNRISIISLLANLVIVPLLSLGLVGALLMIIFSLSLGFINNLLGPLMDLLLNLQFIILGLLARLPFNLIKVFSPDLVAIGFYYVLIVLVFRLVDLSSLNLRYGRSMLVFLALIIGLNGLLYVQDDSLQLHFIDVGQGDALLIRTREGDYLMDTGGSLFASYDIGKSITLPYLEKVGVRSLEAVFISHFHEDHSQGLEALMDNLKIKRILASYYPAEGEIRREIGARKIPFTILEAGDRLRLGQDLTMEILWPREESREDYSENNRSLVGLLRYKDYRILLTGDLEKEGEDQLAGDLDRVHMVKVPHHGSPTSSSQEFLNSLRPKYGIIPVGKNNMYGHPSSEVVERYRGVGTNLYRTDRDGLILASFSNQGLEIKTYLEDGQKPRLDLFEFLNGNLFEIIFYSLILLLSYIFVRIENRGGCRHGLQ